MWLRHPMMFSDLMKSSSCLDKMEPVLGAAVVASPETLRGEPYIVRVTRDVAQREDDLPAAAFGVLRDAARTRNMDAEVVEGAMVYLEGLSSSGQLAEGYLPDINTVLEREYALVFSTATSFRPFQYIPVKARPTAAHFANSPRQ
jgi:hypothetical protein